MSTPVDIWRNPLLKIAHVRVHSSPAEVSVCVPSNSYDRTVSALARQIFFPTSDVRRTRVLLAASGPESNVFGLAQDVGNALSELTQATVALVENPPHLSETAALQQRSGLVHNDDAWRQYGSQIKERVWRIPGLLFAAADIADRFAAREELPFEYLIFAATVTDSMFQVFCSQAQGVVLAVTANCTRREPAIQAQRTVQQCNGKLLGTVLLGRRFPIPEAIYRRI